MSFDLSFLNAPPKDAHKVQLDGQFRQATGLFGNVEMASDIKKSLYKLNVPDYLAIAAPHYHISKNIHDYVVAPVIICPTDIPNRNSVAFPYEELLQFNPNSGGPSYKSWNWKPTYMEHKNNVVEEAKGVVFDTIMKPMAGTKDDLAKVICLCAFDITKDPKLAKDIRDRRRINYSMGAMVECYECSICGDKIHTANTTSRNTRCGHVTRGQLRLYNTSSGMKKPGYYLARNITGYEVSSVSYPAWISASEDRDIYDMT